MPFPRIICRHTQTLFTSCVGILVLFAIVNFSGEVHFLKHYTAGQSVINPAALYRDEASLQTINLKNIPNMVRRTNGTLRKRGKTILPITPWANRSSVSKSSQPRYHLFKPIISTAEHSQLIETFRVFKNSCDWWNLKYMVYGGSLLGSYRHHGMVPWDDDIDVLVNESDKPRLTEYLSNIPGYALCTPQNRQWKFYQIKNDSHDNCSENMWPYVDIFFFSENDTHIWDNNEMYKFVYNFAKQDIFPLKYSVFEGELVSAPQNILNVLQRSYNIDLCVNSVYFHKEENVLKGKLISLPCKRIFTYFPFVFRQCEDSSINEYLINDAVLAYKVLTDNKC